MNLGTAIGYLELDTSNFNKSMDTAYGQFKAFADSTNDINTRVEALGGGMKSLGSTMSKYVTLPLVAVGAGAIKASIDFESAFAGVKKTLDTTGLSTAQAEQAFKDMEVGIMEMSGRLPQSSVQIAEIAEAAGQLGIKRNDVLGFTEVMVKMGDATNLSSTEAAENMARFINVIGKSADDIPDVEQYYNQLGSAIVALGNNSATTESDIMAMTMRLASAASQVGMSEGTMTGFAAALSSVGIQAEAGGSAFSKLMINMQLATETGGESLNQFADVAGMSADQFKKSFKDDASGAIISFLEGLSKAEEKGKSAIGILDEMGISEVVLRDTILRSTNAVDLMRNSVELGNEAFNEGTALTNEAEQRYQTLESQLSMTKNTIVNLAKEIGDRLTPYVKQLNEFIKEMAEKFAGLSEEQKDNIVKFGLIAAAIGPVLLVLGNFIIFCVKVATALGKIKKALGDATGSVILFAKDFKKGETAIQSFSKKAISSIKNLPGSFRALGTVIKTQFLGVLISVNTFISTTLIPMFTAFTGFLTTTAFTIGAVTIPIWAVIAAIAALIAIGYLVIKNWDEIKEACGKAWSWIKEKVSEAIDWVINKWYEWMDALGFDWNGFVDTISAAWGLIKRYTTEAWANIKEEIYTAWLTIQEIVINFGQAIWERITEAWQNIKDIIHDYMEAIWVTILNTWDEIFGGIGDIFNSIQYLIDGDWEGFKQAISDAIQRIKDAIITGWNDMWTLIFEAGQKIWNEISTCWNDIGQIISEAIDVIKQIISDTWENIKTITGEAWDKCKLVLSTAWENIKTIVSDSVEHVKNKVRDKFEEAKQQAEQKVESMKQAIINKYNEIKDSIQQKLDEAKQWVQQKWDDIKSTTERIVNNIPKIVSTVFNGIKDDISEGLSKAWDKANDWWESIKDIFKNPISAVVNFVKGGEQKGPLVQTDDRSMLDNENLVKSHNAEMFNNYIRGVRGVNESISNVLKNNNVNLTINNVPSSEKNITINNTYNSPQPASIAELKEQDEIQLMRLGMQLGIL